MMDRSLSNQARRLTGTGRSAIATILIEGDLARLDVPQPLFLAANGKPISQQTIDVLCFGVWGEPGEDMVVCRTSEQSIEVTCHGGAAAVGRVLNDLARRGFSLQANGRHLPAEESLAHAVNRSSASSFEDTDEFGGEGWGDATADSCLPLALRHARTQRTAEILLEQASGMWDRFVSELHSLTIEDARCRIAVALTWAEFGRHLVEPWNVVLCGRPNVGKSSLMNALAGFTRSIVSEQAGTTRDRVTLETAIDGWPVRISDTAGVRDTSDSIEQQGVQQTRDAIRDADLVVIVLDASESLHKEDQLLLEIKTRRRLVVAHKSDLPRPRNTTLPAGCVDVSSVQRQGLDRLLEVISEMLVPRLPPHDQLVPVNSDQVATLQQMIPTSE